MWAVQSGLRQGETVELRAFGQNANARDRRFFADYEQAARWGIEHSLAGMDVYFGIAPRMGAKGGRNEDVARIGALWLDADFKGGHDYRTRRDQLASLPIPPSILVHSGGGLQAYWLLDEPIGPEQFMAARSVMRELAERFGCDKTDDPARIFRVPCTLNRKYDPAPEVTLLQPLTPDVLRARVSLAQLRAAVSSSGPPSEAQDEPQPGSQPVTTIDPTARPDPVWHQRDYLIAQGVPEGGNEHFDGRNRAMFEWIMRRRNDGWGSQAAAEEALRWNQAYMRPPLTLEELRRTGASVYGWQDFQGPNITVVPVSAAVVENRRTVMGHREVRSIEEVPVDWLSRGTLARGDIVFVPDAPKQGKTTIMLNWATRLAYGSQGAGMLPERPLRVLFCSLDMGPRMYRDWLRRMADAIEQEHPELVGRQIHFDSVWGCSGDAAFQFLLEVAGGYDVVFVDTLGRVFPAADAIDTERSTAAMSQVRVLRDVHSLVCWIWAVQAGKSSLQFKGGDNEAFLLRGNSAIAETYDTMLAIRIPNDSEEQDGVKVNRIIVPSGRLAGEYRAPWRTRWDPQTKLLTFAGDVDPDELAALTRKDHFGGDVTGRPNTARRDAADWLQDLFEHTGVKEMRPADIKAAEGYGDHASWDTYKRAWVELLGGQILGSANKTRWVRPDRWPDVIIG